MKTETWRRLNCWLTRRHFGMTYTTRCRWCGRIRKH